MVSVPSTMLALGTPAPDFALPDTDGRVVHLADYRDAKALLVMFICNHCPYVKHVQAELARIGRDYVPRGVGIVAISSNDVANYPDDSPEKMRLRVEHDLYYIDNWSLLFDLRILLLTAVYGFVHENAY